MSQLLVSLRAPAPFRSGSGGSGRRQQQQQLRRVAVRAQAEPEQQQAAAQEPQAAAPRPDACPTCGVPLSEKAFGCDGSGRIAGGIGAVPGFGWWPIKAYRPCPKAGAAGVAYQRKGQITDEVLFGRGRQ